MKKIMFSFIVTLFLATGVQANQENPDSVAYEKLTIKPEMQFRPSIDPDVKVEFIKIKSIEFYTDRYGHGRLVMDLEIIDYNGNHTFRTCEKKVEGGHDYYYEVITEEMKAKGEIKNRQ